MRSLTLLLLFIVTSSPSLASPTGWIAYDDVPFGIGEARVAVGATVIAVGYETTEQLVFFDATRGVWHEHAFAAAHEVVDVQAAGPLALVVLDDRAVAFLAGDTSHTIDLEGTVLSNFSGSARECGEDLAAVATDQALYVFDSSRESWRTVPYAPPVDHNGGFNLAVGDVWVGLELRRDYPAPPMNVAYSRILGAGSQTLSGCQFPTVDTGLLDGGFAGLGGAGASMVATAWSAYCNTFDTVHAPYPVLGFWQMGVDGSNRDTRRVALVGWLTNDDGTRRYTALGFHTQRGCWDEFRKQYAFGSWSGGQVWDSGGCFASTICNDIDGIGDHALIYDGENGRWEAYHPLSGEYDFIVAGGQDLLVFNDDFMMGRCVPTGCDAVLARPGPLLGSAHWGEHFLASGFFQTVADDSMDVRIYRGPSNRWWCGRFGTLTGSANTVGTHLYALRHGGGILLYSDLSDVVHRLDLDAGVHWSVAPFDKSALVRSTAGCLHFDGTRGVVHDLGIAADGIRLLGDDLVAVSNAGSSVFHHWSARDGMWRSTDLGEVPSSGNRRGRIALLTVPYYARFWALDAYSGSWTPLQPEGSSAGYRVGDDTAFVQRSSVFYGFAPGSGVSTAAETPVARTRLLSALRAWPNPFNPSLRLDFRLAAPAHVRVDVFDSRGRRVARLLDAEQPAGVRQVEWRPVDVSAGVYLCRVCVGDEVLARKISLIP